MRTKGCNLQLNDFEDLIRKYETRGLDVKKNIIKNRQHFWYIFRFINLLMEAGENTI